MSSDGAAGVMRERQWFGVGLVAVCRWFAYGGGLLLALVVAVTVINIGAFGLDRLARLWDLGAVSGLPGYEDFVRLAIGAGAPMFVPYCQARRGHLAVEAMTTALPTAAVHLLDRGTQLLLAAMALLLAYGMLLGMIEARADGTLSRVLGWPEWPFYLPGLASLVLWAAVALVQAIKADAIPAPSPHETEPAEPADG